MINKFTSIKFLSLISFSILVSFISLNASAQWSPMGSGFNGPVRAIAVVGNTLYAAGKFTMSGSTTVNNVAQWNGSAWIAMGGGTKGVNDSVNALISFNNELYATGAFTSAGGVTGTSYIAKWTGSAWVSVGTFNNTGRCFYNFKGSLIASGYFTSPYMNIAKYVSGTSWAAVGNAAPGGTANAMTTHAGELYISREWGSSPSVQYLDDTTNAWVNLPSGPSGEVKALASFKKQGQVQLYIGGNLTAGGITNFCTYLAGFGYTAPPYYQSGSGGDFNCLYTNATHIYAGGGFSFLTGSTPMSMLARYNGGAALWTAFGNDVNNFNSEVISIGEFNNHLIAGGRFTQFGTTAVNYVAQSSGLTSIEDLNDNLVMNNFYPNPMTTDGKLEIESKNILSNPSLKVFDIAGKEIDLSSSQRIFDKGSSHVEFRLNKGNLSQGVYYYSVSDKGSTIATGKIVLSN